MKKLLTAIITLCIAFISITPVSAGDIKPMTDEYIYYYVDVEDPVYTSWSKWVIPAGQPEGGQIFNSKSDGYWWVSTGGTNGTFTFSVSIAGELVSLSMAYNTGSTSQTTLGTFYAATIINKPVILKVSYKYKIQKYAIYRYSKYSGKSTARLVGYDYRKTLYTMRHTYEAVK